MNVQIVVRVDGRDAAEIVESVETLDALDLEEHVERIKRRAERAMLEVGLTQLGPPQAVALLLRFAEPVDGPAAVLRSADGKSRKARDHGDQPQRRGAD